MQIRVGYEIVYDCVQPTPMVLMLHVHHSRVRRYPCPGPSGDRAGGAGPCLSRFAFGNWCTRDRGAGGADADRQHRCRQ